MKKTFAHRISIHDRIMEKLIFSDGIRMAEIQSGIELLFSLYFCECFLQQLLSFTTHSRYHLSMLNEIFFCFLLSFLMHC